MPYLFGLHSPVSRRPINQQAQVLLRHLSAKYSLRGQRALKKPASHTIESPPTKYTDYLLLLES
jgi:hypothetical protein